MCFSCVKAKYFLAVHVTFVVLFLTTGSSGSLEYVKKIYLGSALNCHSKCFQVLEKGQGKMERKSCT